MQLSGEINKIRMGTRGFQYFILFQNKKDDSSNGNTGKFSHLQIIFLENCNSKLNLQRGEKKVKGGHCKI